MILTGKCIDPITAYTEGSSLFYEAVSTITTKSTLVCDIHHVIQSD